MLRKQHCAVCGRADMTVKWGCVDQAGQEDDALCVPRRPGVCLLAKDTQFAESTPPTTISVRHSSVAHALLGVACHAERKCLFHLLAQPGLSDFAYSKPSCGSTPPPTSVGMVHAHFEQR